MPRKNIRKASRVAKYTIQRHIEKSVVLPQIQRLGFTHPRDGHFIMIPRECDVVLALESNTGAQVIFAIFRHTVGRPGTGPHGRTLWVEFSRFHRITW